MCLMFIVKMKFTVISFEMLITWLERMNLLKMVNVKTMTLLKLLVSLMGIDAKIWIEI